MEKENNQWGNKEWKEHWGLDKKENKKVIPNEIKIVMDFQIW